MSDSASSPSLTPSRRYTVGYALPQKKVESFIQPSLINHAEQRGIDLVPIDTSKPLIAQGPFDCIIHKLYSDEWTQQLIDFKSLNLSVIIIDPPNFIQPLHNRNSMLEVVNQLEAKYASSSNVIFGTPRQILINDMESLLAMNLKFPVIAKPLVANGSANSHEMLLVFNSDGLKKVKPPTLLQEFVNHGGVIFKVYVAGEYVQCVKRRSLPDVFEEGSSEGILSFSQISNLTKEHSVQDEDKRCFSVVNIEEAELPPTDFVMDIASSLRRAMKLHLFNFDMIRDASNGNMYLVIDINYFPGYAKMPGFETILTDFFWDILHGKDDVAPLDNIELGQGGASGSEGNRKFTSNTCGSEDEKDQPVSSISIEEESTVQV